MQGLSPSLSAFLDIWRTFSASLIVTHQVHVKEDISMLDANLRLNHSVVQTGFFSLKVSIVFLFHEYALALLQHFVSTVVNVDVVKLAHQNTIGPT